MIQSGSEQNLIQKVAVQRNPLEILRIENAGRKRSKSFTQKQLQIETGENNNFYMQKKHLSMQVDMKLQKKGETSLGNKSDSALVLNQEKKR